NVESAKELWDSLESKYMAEDASSKKFLVSNFNNYKMIDSRPVMEQFNELLRILGQYTQHGLKMDESISVSSVIVNLPPSWKDFTHTLKHEEDAKNKHHTQNKGKNGPMRTTVVLVPTRNQSWNVGNVARLVTSKGIAVVVKRTKQMLVVRERGLRTNPKTKVDAIAWWIDSGTTTHVCKVRCWFTTYEPVEDGSVLYMGNDHFAPIHGKGSMALEFSSRKTITLLNVLYVPKLRKNLVSGPMLNKCGYKQVYKSDKYILAKSGVFVGFGYYNNGMFILNLNKVPDDSDSIYMSSSTVVNSSLWHARLGYVHYKRMLEMYKDDLVYDIDENLEKSPYTPQQNGVAKRKNKTLKEMVNSMLSYSGLSEGFREEAIAVVRLPDPKRKTLGEKGIDCIFVGYAEHYKAYRFYVIESNDFVSINSIIESRDAIFDENRFSSIPRPKDIIPNSVESQRDDHSDDVPSEIPKPRKDPRAYNEAMQSRDAAFWKKAIYDEIGSIMENNTWVLSDLPPGCKWIFKRKMKVDGTVDKFKARLKFNREDCSPVSTPMDPVEKLRPNTVGRLSRFTSDPSRQHWQAITRVFKYLKGTMNYGLSYVRYPLVSEGYSDASWINHVEDSSSSSGWVFLFGGGAISWASKKLTCITDSTREYEFVALAAAGKEAEWLRNLIHEILIWPKPIAPISIHCDSVATLAKAYSQMYNGKSRHLGVRHSMIRELIMNSVISIEFVRSQHNLADHLTKGLARDLVNNSVIGMGLKSI
ncbi:zinc finger, CCHC-type containing protein, partial [Tanacetum coccineum]